MGNAPSHEFAEAENLLEGYQQQLRELRESAGERTLEIKKLESELEYLSDWLKHFRYYTSLTEKRDDFDAGLQLCFFGLNLIERIDATLPQTQEDFEKRNAETDGEMLELGVDLESIRFERINSIGAFRQKLGREVLVLTQLLDERLNGIRVQLRRFHNSQPVTFQGRSAPSFAEIVLHELRVRDTLGGMTSNEPVQFIPVLGENAQLKHDLQIEFEEAKCVDVSQEESTTLTAEKIAELLKKELEDYRKSFSQEVSQVIAKVKNSDSNSKFEAIEELEPRLRKAYKSYDCACRLLEEEATDRKAYDYLKEMGVPEGSGDPDLVDYELLSFETWTSYLSKARKELGLGKYGKLADRISARSVVGIDQIDQKPDGT